MSSRSRITIALAALVLAPLLGGCGQRSNMIPESQAGALTKDLEQVRTLLESGDCDQLGPAIEAVRQKADGLPDSVNSRLRRRIRTGVTNLEQQAPSDCRKGETTPEPATTSETETTPTETATETTPTETATDTTPTATEPQPTTAEPATPTATTPTTATPTTPDPGSGGGVTPGDGDGAGGSGGAGLPGGGDAP